MKEVIRNVIKWNATQCALALCDDYQGDAEYRAERQADAKRFENNIKALVKLL